MYGLDAVGRFYNTFFIGIHMKKQLFITVAIIQWAVATHSFAKQMQTLTDDAGRTVSVPKNPERLISGHDAIVATALYELEFNLVASTMRKDTDTGKFTIFGIKPLFGTTVEQQGIAYIGGRKELDFELMRSLNPDLFIGYEGMQKHADKFVGIAPMFINRSRLSSGNESQKLIAQRFGAMEKYTALDTEYQKRLAEIKAKIPYDPATKTYLDVLVSDRITAMNYIGGINKVMNDLGFKTPEWLQGTVGRLGIAPEQVKKMDVDIVFMSMMYYKSERGTTDIDTAMDKVVPGWDKFLHVKKDNNIIYYDSYLTLSPTFASAFNVLDYLDAYYSQ